MVERCALSGSDLKIKFRTILLTYILEYIDYTMPGEIILRLYLLVYRLYYARGDNTALIFIFRNILWSSGSSQMFIISRTNFVLLLLLMVGSRSIYHSSFASYMPVSVAPVAQRYLVTL